MPDDYRVTIRLAPALYAQLEARGSHGQPLAAIVREALEAYLMRQPDRQPEQPISHDTTATTSAAMAASLRDVQSQIQELRARVEDLAADWLPAAATHRTPPRTRQPRAATAASVPVPGGEAFDPARYVLGKLCPRQHDYQGSGQSLLRRTNRHCLMCDREKFHERKGAKRGEVPRED